MELTESTDTTLQQLMFSLIAVWRESGKTQRDFCKEKDLAYSKFQYWLRRYKEHDPSTSDPSTTRSGFVPVKVNDQVIQRTGGLELVYPDGRRLIFHQEVDPSFLRILLS